MRFQDIPRHLISNFLADDTFLFTIAQEPSGAAGDMNPDLELITLWAHEQGVEVLLTKEIIIPMCPSPTGVEDKDHF